MRLIGCVIISLLCCFHGNAQEKAIILKNVNVVDVVEGSIRKGQDVVIKEGIIQAVGKGAGTGVSGEVKDLTGMYVMPGLIDAHVHIANDPKESQADRAKHLEYFLRHGVTSIPVSYTHLTLLGCSVSVRIPIWIRRWRTRKNGDARE